MWHDFNPSLNYEDVNNLSIYGTLPITTPKSSFIVLIFAVVIILSFPWISPSDSEIESNFVKEHFRNKKGNM